MKVGVMRMQQNLSHRGSIWLLVGFLSGCCLWATGVGRAQTGEPPAKKTVPAGMTAEKVLEKSVNAIGGRAVMAKINSVVTKGTISGSTTMQGQKITIDGTIESYQKSPGNYYSKQVIRQSVSGQTVTVTVETGTNGKTGWTRLPDGKIRDLNATELGQIAQQADLRANGNWRNLYAAAELLGVRTVNGRDAYLLRMTPKTGKPVMQYYDTQSFLLVRLDLLQDTPQGTVPIETYFSDYRTVGGMQMPYSVRQRVDFIETTIRITSIQVNVPIPASYFARPAS